VDKQVRSLGIDSPPGRKIYELFVAVESRPSILAKIANLLGERNVDILAGGLQCSDDKKTGFDLFYVEMGDATISPEDLVATLKKQPFVKDAKIESKAKVRFETMMFPLTSGGHTRMFVISAEGWLVLVNSILKTFGTAGGVILHNQGVSVGEQMVEKIKGMFEAAAAKEQIIENLKAYFGAVGFGVLHATQFSGGYKIMIGQPVTAGGEGKFDQFLVGVVRGAMNKVLGSELVVKNIDYNASEVKFELVQGSKH